MTLVYISCSTCCRGKRECLACTRVHSRTPRLCRFIGESSEASRARNSIDDFPDICITFPFCVAGKGSGMEKLLPRPVRPHGEGGEQSVRSPPATVGHICGQLSPLQQSETLCILAYLCALLLSPRAVSSESLCLTRSNPKFGYKRNQKRDTFSSLVAVLLPRLFILMGGWHMKRNHPLCRNAAEAWATSAERFTLRPQWMTSIHWLLTQAYSQWNQGKGEHTHIYNKQRKHLLYQPTQSWLIWCSRHLSLLLITLSLLLNWTLSLSLVSLTINRSRRAAHLQLSVGDRIWSQCVYGCVGCGVCRCGCVLHLRCICECVVVPAERCWQSASLHKSWLALQKQHAVYSFKHALFALRARLRFKKQTLMHYQYVLLDSWWFVMFIFLGVEILVLPVR